MTSFRLIVVASLCGLAATASCTSDPRAPDVATSSAPLRVGPPIDLQHVAARGSLAFRADRGRLAASSSTFEATIAGGALQITPRRTDTVRAEAPLALETSLVTRGSLVLADAAHPASATLEHDGSVIVHRGEITETIANDEGGVEQSWRFDRAPAGHGALVLRVGAKGQRYAASTDHGLHFEAPGSLGLRYGTATWVDANGKRTVVSPRFAGSEIVMTVPDEVLTASSYPAVLDPVITPEQVADQPVTGSPASGDQYSPTIVSAGPGKGFLAVWYDRRGIRPSLYGARIASDGTVLDDTGIPIATGVGSTVPFVSAGGMGFLVTWAVSYVDLYQGPGIYAVRLDTLGKPIDPAPLTLVANQTNLQQPSSAFDGTSWLVAWQSYGGGTSGYDIAGARVPISGAPLDMTPIEISKAVGPEYTPVVTFDGASQLVTWRSYDQIFGRKFGKDGKPLTSRLVLATSPGGSLYNFSIAFDGNEHLLVWSDYGASSYDVFARRIAVSGAPIDLGNLTVSGTVDYDERPRVVWDGAAFVITFARSGALAAQRLSSFGGLIDANATIVNSVNSYYDYGLATDGVGTVAVTRSFGSGLAGSDVSGVVVGRPPIANANAFTVSNAANSETEPVSAWNGTAHFSVWLDTRDGRPAIYGATVSADGQPSGPTKIVSDARFPNELTRPRIASDGAGGYLVVFYAYDPIALKRGVRGVRVDASGKPDATGVFDIYVPPTVNEFAQEPDVAFDGTNYLVVWQNLTNDGTSQTSIAGIRLPKTGTVTVDKEPIRITTATPIDARTVPSVAFDGQNYFVAWITSRPTAAGGIQVSHVYGSRVSKEGGVLEGEQAVCNAFLLQRAPFVAADTTNGGFMVVWEDYRTALETADVYGSRISAQGQNLDGTSGMKIAVGAHDESRPRVAPSGDGTNWVVAWRDLRSKTTYDLYGAWISVAGKNHDPQGLALSAEAGDEDAPWLSAYKDGKLLVAYQRLDPRIGYGSYRVRARSINSGAKVAAPCTKNDDCSSRSCVDGVCCYTECGGCGTCSATPGTCTARPAESEAKTCPAYRCKGTLECPSKCDDDTDCAANATCDPATKKCVSRVICIDDQTLKDLTGKTTACAPYKCTADACRTQCGSVDDCAAGFVCDYGGRCVQAPAGNDGGCAVSSPSGASGGLLLASAIWMMAALARRRRRT
jgi:hypothetical protein